MGASSGGIIQPCHRTAQLKRNVNKFLKVRGDSCFVSEVLMANDNMEKKGQQGGQSEHGQQGGQHQQGQQSGQQQPKKGGSGQHENEDDQQNRDRQRRAS